MEGPLYNARPDRWPRFSLRFLLIALVILCLLLGSQFNLVLRRKGVQKQLEASGATVSVWDKVVDFAVFELLRNGNAAGHVSGVRSLMGDRDVLRIDFPREPTPADLQSADLFPEAEINYIPRVKQGPDTRSVSVGKWSDVVDGLRGRLHFSDGYKFNGTRLATIYLELENVSDRGNPMQFYFDEFTALDCELRNSAGKPAPSLGGPMDYMSVGPHWMELPHGASLRLPVSINGHGVHRLAGTMIGLAHECWTFTPNTRADFFLTGTFHPRAPQGQERENAWQGTLKLPKLRIPLPRP